MYDIYQQAFRTPRGRMVDMWLRLDTNDYNTLNACLNEDEYGLRNLELTGTAIDIGAYLGGVTVALLEDNPDLHVVAIEPVPPNVELLRRNLEPYGDRVTVLAAAASKGKTATIHWAFEGNYVADHHAFVGNAQMPQTTTPSKTEQTPVRTLASIVKEFGPLSFCKIDCELCEFDFLRGPALAQVERIRGEVHRDDISLYDVLAKTHDVTWPQEFPGAFEAVRR